MSITASREHACLNIPERGLPSLTRAVSVSSSLTRGFQVFPHSLGRVARMRVTGQRKLWALQRPQLLRAGTAPTERDPVLGVCVATVDQLSHVLGQWFSICALSPSKTPRGTTHVHIMIHNSSKVIRSSNEIVFKLGCHHNMENYIKGWQHRKVENHCPQPSREGLKPWTYRFYAALHLSYKGDLSVALLLF